MSAAMRRVQDSPSYWFGMIKGMAGTTQLVLKAGNVADVADRLKDMAEYAEKGTEAVLRQIDQPDK